MKEEGFADRSRNDAQNTLVNLVTSSQKSIDSDNQGVDQGTSSSIQVLVKCVGDDSSEVVHMETR